MRIYCIRFIITIRNGNSAIENQLLYNWDLHPFLFDLLLTLQN